MSSCASLHRRKVYVYASLPLKIKKFFIKHVISGDLDNPRPICERVGQVARQVRIRVKGLGAITGDRQFASFANPVSTYPLCWALYSNNAGTISPPFLQPKTSVSTPAGSKRKNKKKNTKRHCTNREFSNAIWQIPSRKAWPASRTHRAGEEDIEWQRPTGGPGHNPPLQRRTTAASARRGLAVAVQNQRGSRVFAPLGRGSRYCESKSRARKSSARKWITIICSSSSRSAIRALGKRVFSISTQTARLIPVSIRPSASTSRRSELWETSIMRSLFLFSAIEQYVIAYCRFACFSLG